MRILIVLTIIALISHLIHASTNYELIQPSLLIGSIETSLLRWQSSLTNHYISYKQSNNASTTQSTFSLTPSNNTGIRHAFVNGSIDFAFSTIDPAYQTINPSISLPDVASYPVAGYPVVIAFNCGPSDACNSPTFSLSITREVVCSILSGVTRTWRELSTSLPVTPIVVAASEDPNNASTDVITRFCSLIDANWTSTIGVSTTPKWWNTIVPRVNRMAVFDGQGIVNKPYSLSINQSSSCCSSAAQFVSVTPFSITYLTLNEAIAYGLPHAAIINQAGIAVKANASSVAFAVNERSTSFIVRSINRSINQPIEANLFDATNSHAYPLIGTVHLQLYKTFLRVSCISRRELLMYIRWMLLDPIAEMMTSSYNMGLFSDDVNNEFINFFLTQIKCDSVSVVALTQSRLPKLISPPLAGELGWNVVPFAPIPEGQSVAFSSSSAASSNAAVIALEKGIVDFALISSVDWQPVQNMSIGDVLTNDQLGLLPMAYASLQPVLTLPEAVRATSVNDTFYGGPLFPFVLSVETLASIYQGSITSFLHPNITRVNPTLQARFMTSGSDTSITVLLCCSLSSSSQTATSGLISMLQMHSSQFSNDSSIPSLPLTSRSFTTLMSRSSSAKYVMATTETNLLQLALTTDGAIGYTMSFVPSSFHSSRLINLLHDDQTSRQYALSPSTSTMASCSNGLDVTECVIDFNQAGSRCWPLTYPICVVARLQYTDEPQASYGYNWERNVDRSCTAGAQLASLIGAMTGLSPDHPSTTAIKTMLPSFGYASTTSVLDRPEAAYLVNNVIESTVCVSNGNAYTSLLVQTTSRWSISSTLYNVGVALPTIGIFIIAMTTLLLIRERNHAIVRSSSFSLLIMVLLGLAMLFVAASFWISAKSDGMCNSMLWILTIGLTLILCPLLLRIWRVLKIFGSGTKLKVVKISNHSLIIFTSVALLVDIIMLTVLQRASPFSLHFTQATSDSSFVEYGHCSFDANASATTPFLVLQLIVKGGMIVFGIIAAHYTKNVDTRFNESTNVAFTLVNIVLTIGVIVPFIIVLDPVGDQRILLVFVPIVEIAIVTWASMFLPKIIALRKHETNPKSPLAPIMQRLAHSVTNSKGVANFSGTASEPTCDVTQELAAIQSMSLSELKRYTKGLSAQLTAARARLQKEQPSPHATSPINAWADQSSNQLIDQSTKQAIN